MRATALKTVANRLDQVNLLVGNLVRWFALAMVLLQFMLVVMRYVYGVSFVFLDESVLYLHSGLFMLGAGYTCLVNGHVRVDIFYSKLSRRGRRAIDIFGHVFLLLPSMLVLLIYSWPSVKRSWAVYEGAISVGGIPAAFLLKSLIPAFCVLLIIQGVAHLLRDLGNLCGASGSRGLGSSH